MATAVNSKLITVDLMDDDNIGTQLMHVSANLRQDVADLNNLAARMLQMFSTTTPDYTLIESIMGLAAGDGVVVWGIVNNANTQIQGDASVQKLMNWLISKHV